jgi:hypothetical protein
MLAIFKRIFKVRVISRIALLLIIVIIYNHDNGLRIHTFEYKLDNGSKYEVKVYRKQSNELINEYKEHYCRTDNDDSNISSRSCLRSNSGWLTRVLHNISESINESAESVKERYQQQLVSNAINNCSGTFKTIGFDIKRNGKSVLIPRKLLYSIAEHFSKFEYKNSDRLLRCNCEDFRHHLYDELKESDFYTINIGVNNTDYGEMLTILPYTFLIKNGIIHKVWGGNGQFDNDKQWLTSR